ncbi:endo alpha-1,4 polygalactosaminidase [Microbacterium tenebrionis]|uniref:endo alpha-1,4 polygalactosaminidase n=1 Tax=Microbacterium tenebrionis TaxID=2830665 RepID=UPI0015896DEE|nr:endo alpha-1,4 polygalactosaminidase [Microbacterium ihumii]
MRSRTWPVPAILAVLLTGCANGAAEPVPPPPDAAFDYQLGGAYEPAAGVEIVVRDRTASPHPDLYSVCYVNAFQTQPGDEDAWPETALLTDDSGVRVVDPDWPDEVLLDIADPEGAAVVVDRIGGWVRGCAADGFDAVEFDNLDSFTRSNGALSQEDAVAVAKELVDTAHASGLAAAQKNAAEHAVALRDDAGFDFAIAEECAAYGECTAYTEVYATVLDIEYTDNLPESFEVLCARPGTPRSAIVRDRDLTRPGDSAYVRGTC